MTGHWEFTYLDEEVISHNGMDVDLKMASRISGIDAIFGGHTHDGIPAPTVVKNPADKTLVTNAGSNGKFLGVMDLDVKAGKVRDQKTVKIKKLNTPKLIGVKDNPGLVDYRSS